MESNSGKKSFNKNKAYSKEDEIDNNFKDEYENLSDDEDIDIEGLTSNKIQKSINTKNTGKKLYVVLEHA